MTKLQRKLLFLIVLYFSLAYLASSPAQYLFIKAFIPFPKLEEAALYEGKMEVVGTPKCRHRICGAPKYYITTSDGQKHEIFYGLRSDKSNRYDKEFANEATGKFWFHLVFGVIQDEITFHDNGMEGWRLKDKTYLHPYTEEKDFFENHFNGNKYSIQLPVFLLFLVLGFIHLYKIFNIAGKGETG
ncbi:MAG: hypothetical protein SFU55_12115 [Methylophilus sp.]|nr:hypothetical protein [Methylophilus sp.]